MNWSKVFLILSFALCLKAPVASPAPVGAEGAAPPVLAFYYAWFDQNTWSSGQTTDTPAEPYVSADRATIERQVAQAQGAGIDAFVQSWYGPQEGGNQTETNFQTLLEVAGATGFQAAVHFETTGPFFGDAGAVTNALATLLATHARHPAYLRYQGKPVIFFWRQQRFSVDQWAAIRNQVDPDRTSYWIAEGTDLSFQSIFDGHHLYNIAWAASPADQLARWGDRVRNYELQNGVDRLWVATAMPGYNDTNLPRGETFAIPRRNGDYFRETWRGAVASQPDLVIITSFNEWLEGTQLEPSVTYGNLYLDVTRELVTALRGSPPPATAPVAAPAADAAGLSLAAQAQQPPDVPYIQMETITNVRSGPSTDFELVGRLGVGETATVIGRNEAGDWWQIEFAVAEAGVGWVAAEVVAFVGQAAEVPVVEAGETAGQIEPPPATEERPASTPTPRPSPTQSPTPTPTEIVIAGQIEVNDPINVRAGPSEAGELVGGMYLGESANVLAVSEDGEWWQIEFPAAPEGLAWVAAEFVRFRGDRDKVPIFGVGTVTPTPTATRPATATPTAIPLEFPPEFAPTATSVYQATSVSLLAARGTPDPALSPISPARGNSFEWRDIPWGILSAVVLGVFLWYQWRRRRS